jgi:hypothetical protein
MEPWSHEIVRGVSTTAALASVVLGGCLLIGFTDSASLVAGGCLVAYAASVTALWLWPSSRAAVVTRLLFSVVGVTFGAMTLRPTLQFLTDPPQEACGLPTVAALALCTLFGIFVAVELASWVGWRQLRRLTKLLQQTPSGPAM